MAYLDVNPSADKNVSIIVELIKSGRYADPNVSVERVVEETSVIKKAIEHLYEK